MDEKLIIAKVTERVKETLSGAEGGHDWWHIYRVLNTALQIAEKENADKFIVELTVLLHDIADAKFHDGEDEIAPRTAREIMSSCGVPEDIIDEVVKIIENMSFRSEIGGKRYDSPELRVVQDADRLDAIGAIGIARAFNYGGHKGREIYNPEIPPLKFNTGEEYKSNKGPTINHFYEKLLLLKDMMKTEEGKRLAEERHEFMEKYLEQFYKEFNNED